MTDIDLLRQYSSHHSEEAFAALVERYRGLVYSAALRQTKSPQDAQDIAQVVFTILARKAAGISTGTVLAGWLLRTTHFVVLNARRRESHRRQTERNAADWHRTETETAWEQIAPILDEALVSLTQKDRDALTLRFFERKSFRDIAPLLRTSEDGAQKRVSRALERLRVIFAQRGVVLPGVMLVTALSSKAVERLPSELLTTLSTRAVLDAGRRGSQLTERCLSALDKGRRRSLVLRPVILGILILLTLIGVVRVTHRIPLSPNSKHTRSQSQPGVAPLPSQAVVTAPVLPRAAGQLLLHIIDLEDGRPVSKAQLRSLSGTQFPNIETNSFTTDAEGVALVSYAGKKGGLWNWRIEVRKGGYEPRFVNWGAARGDTFDTMPTEYSVGIRRGHVIGGTIADRQGNPIPGAQIRIHDSSDPNPLLGGEARREGLILNHIEMTDFYGHWSCNHAPEDLETVTYAVSHPDYIAADFRAVKAGSAATAGVNHLSEDDFRNQSAVMTLGAGIVMTGTVLDENGIPIPGAAVTQNRAWTGPEANQVTDLAGKFRFGNAAPSNLIITVQAPGFLAEEKTVQAGVQGQQLRFLLKRGNVLRGQVVNEQGEPIARAWVVPPGENVQQSLFQSRIITDSQGRFEWGSAPSQASYGICAEGYKSADRMELAADGSDHIVTLSKFIQPSPVRVAGEVWDAKTSLPVRDFQVWAAATLREETSSSFPSFVGLAKELKTTGTNGNFSFLVFEDEDSLQRLDIEVRGNGYLSAMGTLRGPLSNGCELVLRAEPILTLVGAVESPDGGPAVAAQVLLCARFQNTIESECAYMSIPGQVDMHLTRACHTLTDAKGRFTLQPRTTSGTLLVLHKSGFAQLTNLDSSIPGTVRLAKWGEISGTLMIINQPGVGKLVSLDNLRPATPADTPALRVHLDVTTDAGGHFFFERVPPGEWILSPHSYPVQVGPGQRVQVALGGGGRRLVGRIDWKDKSVPVLWKHYFLTLTTELPGLPAPTPDEFASEAEFAAARRVWYEKKSQLLRSSAGAALRRGSRCYQISLAEDGSFSVEEALPGTYELTFLIDPLRADPRVADRLAAFCQRVIIPPASDTAIVDLGPLEIN